MNIPRRLRALVGGPPPAKLALVVAGGGTRGDFEIGVLRYLYERGHLPEIVCGTSAGAITAAKLAEGGKRIGSGGKDERVQAFEELEQTWLRLHDDQDMWRAEAWWTGVQAELRDALGDVLGVGALL